MTARKKRDPAANTGSRRRGTVGGLEERLATQILVGLAGHLLGKRVSRSEVFAALDGQALTEPQRQAIVAAFLDLPSVQKNPNLGLYDVREGAVGDARHRTWRFALGQLGYDDARKLYDILYHAPAVSVTPRIQRMMARLEEALEGLE